MNNHRRISGLFVFALVFASVAFGGAASAGAATACFDWSCSNNTCSFNAACSSGQPFIWKYSWTFGDGASSGLIGSSSVSHGYGPNGPAYPNVTLLVIPWGEDPVSVTCQIVVKNPFSPPLPQSGRCTSSSRTAELQERTEVIGDPVAETEHETDQHLVDQQFVDQKPTR